MSQPIGIFDSGVGGLSVAKEIRHLLPHEDLLYYADSAYCPYGDKDPAIIRQREKAITEYLVKQGAKMIVVACNTASSTGLEELRSLFKVPIVGMEPGVKPAVAATKNGKIGVLATCVTIAGDRFASLVKRYAEHTTVINQPCPGLVELIEQGKLNTPETREVLRGFLLPILEQGADTVVLGCTHYPFLRPLIEEMAGPDVKVIDTGLAVAMQVKRVLQEHNLATQETTPGREFFFTSGSAAEVSEVIRGLWPGDNITVQRVELP
ncbi:glutamate racemase [Desulforamulus ferrireducens]|uniref:Glutamate racemase n=1 Tax=Desulforamulus ferrireducens TaxID=1833852 RepID=A0A1S6IV46_9FIRM|nr:glutamate racemase [Desulforamulus ferrireducens]AQS58649.1 glutamate racemase [Desulforamulus ferrireducens]